MHFVYVFTAKFVVSSCAYCKLRRDFGFFCSVNHLIEGDGEWIFCPRKEADVALLLQVTGIRKITKICEANLNLSIISATGRSQSNEP